MRKGGGGPDWNLAPGATPARRDMSRSKARYFARAPPVKGSQILYLKPNRRSHKPYKAAYAFAFHGLAAPPRYQGGKSLQGTSDRV